MKFSQHEVAAQWQRLRAAAAKFLHPVGMFESGNGSDGASTRAGLQLREMQQLAPTHHQAFTLNADYFIYSAKKVMVGARLRSVTNMHSQEYVRMISIVVVRVKVCACARAGKNNERTSRWFARAGLCVGLRVCVRACSRASTTVTCTTGRSSSATPLV